MEHSQQLYGCTSNIPFNHVIASRKDKGFSERLQDNAVYATLCDLKTKSVRGISLLKKPNGQ